MEFVNVEYRMIDLLSQGIHIIEIYTFTTSHRTLPALENHLSLR